MEGINMLGIKILEFGYLLLNRCIGEGGIKVD